MHTHAHAHMQSHIFVFYSCLPACARSILDRSYIGGSRAGRPVSACISVVGQDEIQVFPLWKARRFDATHRKTRHAVNAMSSYICCTLNGSGHRTRGGGASCAVSVKKYTRLILRSISSVHAWMVDLASILVNIKMHGDI